MCTIVKYDLGKNKFTTKPPFLFEGTLINVEYERVRKKKKKIVKIEGRKEKKRNEEKINRNSNDRQTYKKILNSSLPFHYHEIGRF